MIIYIIKYLLHEYKLRERKRGLILKKIHWIAFIGIFSIKYHARKKGLFTLESNQNVSFYLK